MKYKKLANGIAMPMLGMGGWAQKEREIIKAFELGYRLIDTAAQYGNESEIGNAIKNCGLKREEIFLTTKLWNDDVRSGNIEAAFESSLRNLQTDYVDLYLIHYPASGYESAWEKIVGLYEKKKVRAIGVSNFQPRHIDILIKLGYMPPHVNQVEAHPYFSNSAVIDYCNGKGIAAEAWCPLGGPGSGSLCDETVTRIASEHERSVPQIILRWQLQRGVISIPKAAKAEHMKANMDVFDFALSENEMKQIDGLDRNIRMGADPDNFSF